MNGIAQKMTYRAVTLILAIALLVPTAVKFSHVFNHHQHEICNGENQTHLHKADLDCNFYKFKLSAPFTIPAICFDLPSTEDNHSINDTSYTFLSEYQKMHYSLRGPPQIKLV